MIERRTGEGGVEKFMSKNTLSEAVNRRKGTEIKDRLNKISLAIQAKNVINRKAGVRPLIPTT